MRSRVRWVGALVVALVLISAGAADAARVPSASERAEIDAAIRTSPMNGDSASPGAKPNNSWSNLRISTVNRTYAAGKYFWGTDPVPGYVELRRISGAWKVVDISNELLCVTAPKAIMHELFKAVGFRDCVIRKKL